METKDIPMELILEPRLTPRWGIEDESLRELAEDIADRGLLQPVAVVPEGERYRLVAGNRRLHACRDLLGWDSISAVVHAADLDQSGATAAENLHRLDLDPVEEALMFASILQDQDLTQEELAERINKSRSYVAKRLMLLDLDDATLGAIINNQISWTHGIELKRLEDMDQRQYFLDLAVNHGVNVRILRQWIDDALAQPTAAPVQTYDASEPIELPPVQYEKLRCMFCQRTEDEVMLSFVPVCQADKRELQRLLGHEKPGIVPGEEYDAPGR